MQYLPQQDYHCFPSSYRCQLQEALRHLLQQPLYQWSLKSPFSLPDLHSSHQLSQKTSYRYQVTVQITQPIQRHDAYFHGHDRHGLYHGHDHRDHHGLYHGLYHGHDHRGHRDRHGLYHGHRDRHDPHGHCGHALRTMHPP